MNHSWAMHPSFKGRNMKTVSSEDHSRWKKLDKVPELEVPDEDMPDEDKPFHTHHTGD